MNIIFTEVAPPYLFLKSVSLWLKTKKQKKPNQTNSLLYGYLVILTANMSISPDMLVDVNCGLCHQGCCSAKEKKNAYL